MKIKYVEWMDSVFTASGNWECSEHAKEEVPNLVRSAGIVLREDKKQITLALGESGTYCTQGLVIPKSCITKMECIKEIK